MSAHTPGPWSSNRLTSEPLKEWSLKVKKGRRVIAEVPYQDYTTWTNARLIAAAPDLLEALKRMASIIDKMGDMPDGFIHPSPWQTLMCEEALTQARAAIKAVEGEKT